MQWHSSLGEHSGTSLDHHRRTAQVVFRGLRIGMLHEVLFQDDFVNKALVAGPVVFTQWRRQGDMKGEIAMAVRQILKVVVVKDFLL